MVEQLDRAYVWAWLPGSEEPVPAGMAYQDGPVVSFAYGRRYLERGDAIPLFLPELPLGAEPIQPGNGLEIAGALRDAGPDSWGQRVIVNRVLARGADVAALSYLTYLVECVSTVEHSRRDAALVLAGGAVTTAGAFGVKVRLDAVCAFTMMGVK